MKIVVPSTGEKCSSLSESDFDAYKIPAPPFGYEPGNSDMVLLFNNSEEALKYGIHLGDVIERMTYSDHQSSSTEYSCSIEKMKMIISCITDQADYSSIEFPAS